MKKIAIFFIFITLIAEASDNTFIIHHSQLKEPARQSSLTYNDAITIPKMFSYQGRLTDTLGNPVPTDTYQLTFRLYTQPIGGTPFWSETQRVLVKEGLFSVLLGAVNPINAVPENGQMWLSLQVGSASELTPRLRIVSTAYSYLSQHSAYTDTADYARTAPTPESVQTAANAHRLQGKDTTDFDNRYVNENQPNSITSQMIIDGTITRNDVALNFKAPYTDTADYARTAPTPESVQTAANAHRLQGKDTTDFDNRYVNENQLNSITSQMIIDGTITGADLNRMGANINQVLKWNGTTWAPANDDSDNDWVRGTPDSVLYTIRPLGIARGGVNNMLYGNYRYTHINLGIACTTGTSAMNYDYCTVGGGYGNKATQSYATVSGGYKNKADSVYTFVGGGSNNRANGYIAAVVGGSGNIASGNYAFVGGGNGDTASGNYTFVGGGFRNKADSSYAFVGGGSNNRANGYIAAVVGGSSNIAGNRAFVGGGSNNEASGNNSFVGGGELNKALGSHAFVGGGFWNTADSAYTFVGGGYYNRTNRNYAAVVGGSGNIASGSYAFVGGGFGNAASGNYAFVGGGYGDTASGNYATVPGGFNNIARGYSSLAAGKYARANHGGCFVWSDSTNFLLESVYTTGVNQFRVRARGGTWFFSNGPMTSGVYLAPNSNSWSGISDMKNITDFSSVDKKELLKLLAQLPIRYYRIKGQEETVKHIGPIAEDFYKAFGVGESDKAINMADADGVLFVAIQALYEENQKLREELELLKAELKKRE